MNADVDYADGARRGRDGRRSTRPARRHYTPPEAGTTLPGTALVRQGVAGQATTPEGPSLQVTAQKK